MQVSPTILFCEFYNCRIFMDRVNSHTKSYNIPRSFEAIITKLELGWPVIIVKYCTLVTLVWDGLGCRTFDRRSRNGRRGICKQKCPLGRAIDHFSNARARELPGGCSQSLAAHVIVIYTYIKVESCSHKFSGHSTIQYAKLWHILTDKNLYHCFLNFSSLGQLSDSFHSV